MTDDITDSERGIFPIGSNGREWIFKNLLHPEQTVLTAGHNKFFMNAIRRKKERQGIERAYLHRIGGKSLDNFIG